MNAWFWVREGLLFSWGWRGEPVTFLTPHSVILTHLQLEWKPPHQKFRVGSQAVYNAPSTPPTPPPLLEGGCSQANVVESDKINCSDVLPQVRLLNMCNWQFSDRVFSTSQFIKPLTVLKSSSYRSLTGGTSPRTHTALREYPRRSLKWIKSRKRYKISKKFLSVGQSTRNVRVRWKENHFRTSQWKSRPCTLL